MGYPMDLNEYSDQRIEEEYQRRQKCKAEGTCHYCGRKLSDGEPCKLKAHRVVKLW